VMAATVTPIRPSVGIPAAPSAPKRYICPACGLSIVVGKWLEGIRSCDTCDTWMHDECYYGRVATLDEWRDFARWVFEGELGSEFSQPTTCPACRTAKEGA